MRMQFGRFVRRNALPNVAMNPLISASGREPCDFPRLSLCDSLRREILFVALDTAATSADALLLTNSNYFVSSAFCDGEIFALRHKKAVTLAILSASLGCRGLRASAEAVRRQWPLARILILGRSTLWLEDHLYDEQIDPYPEPKQLLDTLERLSNKPWDQSTDIVDFDAWRLSVSLFPSPIQESDPTKVVPFERTETKNLRGKPSDVRSWQL